jgi:hypothetical protein
MDETNLLSLIRPWLDNICQITTKFATVSFCKKNLQLNRPPSQRRKTARITTTPSSSRNNQDQTEGTAEYESSLGLDDPRTNLALDYVLSHMSDLYLQT